MGLYVYIYSMFFKLLLKMDRQELVTIIIDKKQYMNLCV